MLILLFTYLRLTKNKLLCYNAKKGEMRGFMSAENSPLVMRNRDYWFDNIKGMLMIFVVIGHMTASFYSYSIPMKYLYDMINSMHMGTFLILSGYMSKRRIDQKDYVSVINKNIVPYITAQLFLYAAAVVFPDGLDIINASYFDKSHFSFFIPIYQLWYLMAIIVFAFVTMKLKPSRRPVLFMVGAILVTLLCGDLTQISVLKLTKIPSHYPFFLLGYLLPKDFMYTLRNKWQSFVAAIPVFIGYAYFMWHQDWVVGIRSIYGLSKNYDSVDEFAFGLHPVFGRLAMVLFVPIIAFAFFAVMPKKKTLLSKLGKNSMSIFVLHGIVVLIFRYFNREYHIVKMLDTPVLQILFVIGCILISFLLGSDFVKKIFRPLLEPNFDIVRIVGTLYDKYKEKQAKEENQDNQEKQDIPEKVTN